MISKEASLATRLSWIAPNVNQLIDEAEQCVKTFVDDSEAKDILLTANKHLQQLRGIMDIVGSNGILMFIREITLLNSALCKDEIKRLPQAKEALAKSIISLKGYIKHLGEGYSDLPVIILPTLNNLRAARDAELLSEHLVFLAESTYIDRSDMGVEDYVSLAPDALKAAGVKLRYHFQKSLVGWYRGENEQNNLQTLQRVSKNLIRLNEHIDLRALWWIAIALAQALELKKLESSVAVKLLVGRLEREIRFFIEQGETRYAENYSHELMKNLLYYVGLAQPGADTLDAVKAAYQLDMHLPQGETLTQLREYYQSPGKKMWKAVSDSLLHDIEKIIRNLDELAIAENDEDQAIIKALNVTVNSIYKIGNTLGIIGLHQASEIIEEKAKTLSSHAAAPTGFDKEERLDYAETLLKLKDVLAEYAETGHDITANVFSNASHLNSEALRNTYHAIIDSLSTCQKQIAEFSKSETAFFQLDNALQELTKVNGVIRLLNQKTLIPLLSGTIQYIENVSKQKQKPSTEQEAKLADILMLLEAIIMTQQQRERDTSLQLRAYDALSELQTLTQTTLVETDLLEQTYQQLIQKKKMPYNKTSPMMARKFQQVSGMMTP